MIVSRSIHVPAHGIISFWDCLSSILRWSPDNREYLQQTKVSLQDDGGLAWGRGKRGQMQESSREGPREAACHEKAWPIPGNLIGRQMSSFFLNLFSSLKVVSSDAQSVTRNQVSVWAICLLLNSCYPTHGHELALGSLSICVRKSGLRWRKHSQYHLWRAMCQDPRNTAKTLLHAHFKGCICDMPSPLVSPFYSTALSSSSSSISFLFSM